MLQTQDVAKIRPRRKTKLEAKAARRAERERFKQSRLAEKAYSRQLKRVAKQVGDIIRTFAPDGIVRDQRGLDEALRKYSQALEPWAQQAALQMVTEISKRDLKAWSSVGTQMGQLLKKEIRYAPTGRAMKALMQEQVDLIKSLPLDAAQRVHKLTIEALSGGKRAKETQKEILRSGKVTASRAMTIARTETSRAATAMTEARATFIGSEGYIWRTAGDSDVRERHKHLEGTFHRWDSPPVAGENGVRAHAGAIYNCRCYPEPVVPDDF